MSLVSIIIPAFNCENTIEKCLLSIEKQTFKNIEVLIIDDGSTDSTSQKINKFLQRTSCIKYKYIFQTNSGVSSARNNGINHADSKYITFIDADDYISAEHIQTLVEQMSKDIDLTSVEHGSVTRYNSDDMSPNFRRKSRILILNKYESLIDLYYKKNLSLYVWDKLYKLDIINRYHIRFREGIKIGEDGLFVNTYLKYVNNICYIYKKTYFYYQNENSVMHRKDKGYLDDLYYANKIGFEFINENYSEVVKKAHTTMLIEGIEYFIRLANKLGDIQEKKYKDLIDYFIKNYKIALLSYQFPLKKKIKVVITIVNLKLHYRIY